VEQRISSLHMRKVLFPMVEATRRHPKAPSALAISWCDGAGPQISAIADPSIQRELALNRLIVNNSSPSCTSTEQTNDLMRVFNVSPCLKGPSARSARAFPCPPPLLPGCPSANLCCLPVMHTLPVWQGRGEDRSSIDRE